MNLTDEALKTKTLDLINRQKAVNKLQAKEIVDLKIKVKEQQAEIEQYKKVNILIAQQRDGRDKEIAELETEIEKLTAQKTSREKDRDYWMAQTRIARDDIKFAKIEAIKEFAERLKEKYKKNFNSSWVSAYKPIDNLVKEMVGE